MIIRGAPCEIPGKSIQSLNNEGSHCYLWLNSPYLLDYKTDHQPTRALTFGELIQRDTIVDPSEAKWRQTLWGQRVLLRAVELVVWNSQRGHISRA